MILGEAFEFGLRDRLPRMVAQVLGGLQFDSRVRVISPLVGCAFGGKQANVHLLLAPLAAKMNGRPVKLVLTREQTFTQQPFRGQTRQRIRLGASVNEKLEAILHDADMAQGAAGHLLSLQSKALPSCMPARTSLQTHEVPGSTQTLPAGCVRRGLPLGNLH